MSSNISRSLYWVCPIHGGFSNLNRCAWPDCPHGVAESSLEVPSMLADKTDIFRRVSWCDPNMNVFHDWQTDSLPTWFSLQRAYEYFANKCIENVHLDQMFHYTSADGALAIIQSGRLRFTDYAYLNDTREITYGLDIIRSVLNSDSGIAGSRALTDLKAHILDGDPFSTYNIYTASFSSKSDSLSQFRLYGNVSLGFEINPIGFGSFKGDIHIGHVVYSTEKQVQLIEIFFALLKQSEKMDASMIESDKKNEVSIEYLISHLLRIASLFKHPAFSDEREVRLMYSESLEIMDKYGQEIAPRQFRSSGGLIVPFTDTFDMLRRSSTDKSNTLNKKLPLKSVVIGPVAQAVVLANGMRELLSAHGYEDVVVSLSEAPLRP